jgi:hypothetical protein
MASGAEDDAAVEAGDGCVLVQDSEKSCLFGMLSKAPDASCLWLTVLAGLKRSCRTVGENLVVMGRSQKERRRGRGFGFLVVRVIEGRCVSVLRMEMERAVCC